MRYSTYCYALLAIVITFTISACLQTTAPASIADQTGGSAQPLAWSSKR